MGVRRTRVCSVRSRVLKIFPLLLVLFLGSKLDEADARRAIQLENRKQGNWGKTRNRTGPDQNRSDKGSDGFPSLFPFSLLPS